jgi:hypothetical protein
MPRLHARPQPARWLPEVAIKGSQVERCLEVLRSWPGISELRERLEGGWTFVYFSVGEPVEATFRFNVEQAKTIAFSPLPNEDLVSGEFSKAWSRAVTARDRATIGWPRAGEKRTA